MEKGNTEIFTQLTEKLLQWLKSEFVSLVYYPTGDSDDPNYFLLLILNNKQPKFDIHFWIDYHQHVESHWDSYWLNVQPEGINPLLSITIRTKESCMDNHLLSLSPEDSYIILFDSDDFYKQIHSKIVVQSSRGNSNPHGDIIWI